MSKDSEVYYKIIDLFPDHQQYSEPFFKNGELFYLKPTCGHDSINDINHNVFNIFDGLRNGISYDQHKVNRLFNTQIFSRDPIKFIKVLDIDTCLHYIENDIDRDFVNFLCEVKGHVVVNNNDKGLFNWLSNLNWNLHVINGNNIWIKPYINSSLQLKLF